MALIIKIGTKEFEYIEALEAEEFYNGASRRTMTVTCAPSVIGVDELNALLTEENLAVITMTNTEFGVTNVYESYVLKLACGIQSVSVKNETPDAPAVYEDRLIFKVGKRTYIEQKLHELGL